MEITTKIPTVMYSYPDEDFEPCYVELNENQLDLSEHDERVVEEVFKWFSANDIIQCENCIYDDECMNLDMRCWQIMKSHFYEDKKE